MGAIPRREYHNIYIVIGRLPVYLGLSQLISPWTSRQEIRVIIRYRWFAVMVAILIETMAVDFNSPRTSPSAL